MRIGFTFAAVLCLSFLPLSASAGFFSRVSLTGGANVSQFALTSASGSTTTSDGHVGLGGGLLLETQLAGAIGLEFGGLYMQRMWGDSTRVYTETRLEIPLVLRLRFSNFSIGGGAYSAIALGTLKTDTGGESTYAGASIKTQDIGWIASVSYLMTMGTWGGIFADGRYSASLLNSTTRDGMTGAYTNMQLLTGLQFLF